MLKIKNLRICEQQWYHSIFKDKLYQIKKPKLEYEIKL